MGTHSTPFASGVNVATVQRSMMLKRMPLPHVLHMKAIIPTRRGTNSRPLRGGGGGGCNGDLKWQLWHLN